MKEFGTTFHPLAITATIFSILGLSSYLNTLSQLLFWQGSPVTVIRDVPSVGIFFAVYELMKHELSSGDVNGLGFGQLMLSGLLAGIPAAALVTPMDVVKTRWQADGGMEKYKVRTMLTPFSPKRD